MNVYFLQICMHHILAVLRIPAERASGFIALGEMAGALDGELVNYLPTIMAPLRDAVCHMDYHYICSLLFSIANIFLVVIVSIYFCRLRHAGVNPRLRL